MGEQQIMLYLVYIVLVYLLFDNFNVFSMAQKKLTGVNPMVVKASMVIGGAYFLDMVIKNYVMEGFDVDFNNLDANNILATIKRALGMGDEEEDR
jgi:hypothetical protein